MDKETLVKHIDEVQNIIYKFCPEEKGDQKRVMEAMNYSYKAGGKRLRPMLMLESFRLLGGKDESICYPFMAALEMIHTYSLIHDDLPAMDNDDLRRGKPTNHKMFDEATAILAGDGLLNLAFETAAYAMYNCDNDEDRINMIKANRILSKKAGIYGMIGGQMADIIGESNKDITLDEIMFIHEHKTACLIESALCIGAALAGASDEIIEKMKEIASLVGIAFQIQDDILDVTSTTEELGKLVGSDEKNEKITYITLVGLDKAIKDQKDMSNKAIDLLNEIKEGDSFLKDLIISLTDRRN
jgi:geranylgeranyl diphosphate synthase type II